MYFTTFIYTGAIKKCIALIYPDLFLQYKLKKILVCFAQDMLLYIYEYNYFNQLTIRRQKNEENFSSSARITCSFIAACMRCKKEEPAPSVSEPESEIAASDCSLTILIEADDSMINTYSLLAVNPDSPWTDADGNSVTNQRVTNTAGADAFIQWMLSDAGKAAIADFGIPEYGTALFYLSDNAPSYKGEIAKATDETKLIHMSTTTSVNDSGLLQYLEPIFEGEYGYDLEWESAGTGKAIAAAKAGNADLILVHAKSQEEDFINAGFARKLAGFDSERLSFMYNYFVLCGPKDQQGDFVKMESVKDAFAKIANEKLPFISRGDKSGTHTKELSLWPEALGITDDPATFEAYQDWYISANAGMGTCLTMANEIGGYILSDKATFLTFEANGGILE